MGRVKPAKAVAKEIGGNIGDIVNAIEKHNQKS